jgi:hypothetical protein
VSSLDSLFFSEGSTPEVVVGVVYQAPADTSHGVKVVINGVVHGPMPWGPLRGATLPAPGDSALCVKPTNSDYWVANWWPFGGV